MPKKIYIVEDEPDMSELLEFILTSEGYEVECFLKGEDVLEKIKQTLPDLFILDLMLPGISGLEVCKNIKTDKKSWNIPVIILTSRDEEFDVVTGLNMGSDDYVTKPFSEKVLLARIKAALNRQERQESKSDGVLQFENLIIDPNKHDVSINGKIKVFTASEFKILKLLAKKPGRVFTRENIFDEITDGYSDSSERSIDIIITRIRKKLGSYSHYIQSLYGVGYRFKSNQD